MRLIISYANKPYFYRSQHFLVESSKKYFDGHASYHPEMLDKAFAEKNKHILNQPRGGGYWLWKPYIILNTLKLVKDGDYVFYVDSGNLLVNDPEPLFKIVDTTSKGILLFENRDGTATDKEVKGGIWQNYMFTKFDCFAKMRCNEKKYIYGNQIDGSYALIKKCDYAIKFFEEYLAWAEDEDILTDKPNQLGSNYPGFRDHRHDQSVCSLLAIRENILVEEEPSEWGNYTRTAKSKFGQIFQHHRGLI